MVSRNPCVHNGDVRKLKAVFKEQLKGYQNVIVFSSKGDRPQQDKMSCGDLDGDIYWINWRKEFVENFIEKEPNKGNQQLPKAEESKEVFCNALKPLESTCPS